MITSVSHHSWDRRVWGWDKPVHPYLLARRVFVAYFAFIGWDVIQLGFHIALACPNVEIHVPFGFFRIGWQMR